MQKIILLWLALLSFNVQAQKVNKTTTSGEIYQAIQKLNFLGSVLYVAAHPDDENTRLISSLSNDLKARTGYLSLTRGDGGQNLIGPELKEQLGVLRTQELLAARRIDGGEQYFTNAIDFGYTKSPEEALEIWGEEQILNDMVWVFRRFKPDVVINRFDHRTAGETHGQHTASALLSLRAFDLAGDAAAYPEQLTYTGAFKPQRIFFNTSPWFYGSQEAFEKADKSNLIELNTGAYFPLKGLSNAEISAESRSQHKSQGFGSTPVRGAQTDYLELLRGKLPEKTSIFAGIDTSWKRVEGGLEISELLAEVETAYDFENPSASLPKLMQAYELIQDLNDTHWKKIKAEEIKEIIAACAGLYLEAVTNVSNATASGKINIELEAINRSNIPIVLNSVKIIPGNTNILPAYQLKENQDWKQKVEYLIPDTLDFTSPYWLKHNIGRGRYEVKNIQLTGLPETPAKLKADFTLTINGTEISFSNPLVYKYTDPVKGEVYQPFEVIPAVSVEIPEKVSIFPDMKPRKVQVRVTAYRKDISGQVGLNASENWKIKPENADFSLKEKGASVLLDFEVTPPGKQTRSFLTPVATINGKSYEKEVEFINYDHIPLQTLVLPATTTLIKLDIQKKGQKIGYIEGAGDLVPENLKQIGYTVTHIAPEAISTAGYLNQFDAVILGIRAYNVLENIKFKQEMLFDYVKNGGTLITQYNTSRGLLVKDVAPYNLELSRDRVTEETAEVEFLAPDHPVLNTPNKISKADFDDWVQERGLYFPEKWSTEFTPVLSMLDKGETAKEGSLLVAKYGKGYFIYTGLSFFRQLPEGVPGAYRLFTNMISIGK